MITPSASIPGPPPFSSLLAVLVAISVARSAIASSPGEDSSLSDKLKAQTQAFSEAGLAGDAAVLGKFLDPQVVFTNETGDIVTRKQIVDGASPAAGDPHIEVTNWQLTRQGDVATATFVDVLTQHSGEQTLVFRYNSTEVWAKRRDGWKMVASQTMVLPTDPPAVRLPASLVDEYVGVYVAGPSVQVKISRDGEGLVSSTNGAAARPLEAEMRDLLFTPGLPSGRRLFQRDAAGHITGYISRRNGNDILLRKVS